MEIDPRVFKEKVEILEKYDVDLSYIRVNRTIVAPDFMDGVQASLISVNGQKYSLLNIYFWSCFSHGRNVHESCTLDEINLLARYFSENSAIEEFISVNREAIEKIISENPFGFEKLVNEEYFNWYEKWGTK